MYLFGGVRRLRRCPTTPPTCCGCRRMLFNLHKAITPGNRLARVSVCDKNRMHKYFENKFSTRSLMSLSSITELLGKEKRSSLLSSIRDKLKVSGILLTSDKQPEREPYTDASEQEKQGHPNDEPSSGNDHTLRILLFTGLVMISLLATYQDNIQETTWPTFLRLMLQTGEVERLDVHPSSHKVYVYLANGAIINGQEVFGSGPHYAFTINNVNVFEEKLQKAQSDLGISKDDYIPVRFQPPDNEIFSILFNVLITMGLLGIIAYVVFGGKTGASGLGGNPFTSHTRAKASIIMPGTGKGVSFKDVAGIVEAKQEVEEFVDYLQHPKRYKELGAKIPKGALLCGAPGTGKTLLAKAIATEASVPFLSMAGSDFVEMFSGVGSARVRDLFAQARKRAPCIIYIDEIDAIGRSRQSSSSSGGNSEQENTLNQLLVEMDGMNTVESVVMLASTNRPDILDQALLRPGRFDRTITIDLPVLSERKDIFEIYLKELKLGESLKKYSQRLAELTPGKSGADIANICNEAALHAARLNQNNVGEQNFEHAIERVIAGLQKSTNTMSPEERKTIAYHESGHAVVSWLLKHTEPVLKVSIIPRTSSPLGYTQTFPLDTKLHNNNQLFDKMCVYLGGRVAEAMIFGNVTTGAEDDLKNVTSMAYRQIVTFGMNEQVGPISFPVRNRGDMSKKPYSDKMAKLIDDQASLLVNEALKKTEELLRTNKEKLINLAEALLDKEVLKYEDIEALIGSEPYGNKRQNFYDNMTKGSTTTDEHVPV